MKRFDKRTLKLIVESTEFGINDDLSKHLTAADELSEEDLECVAAAGVPDFEKFRERYEKNKN